MAIDHIITSAEIGSYSISPQYFLQKLYLSRGQERGEHLNLKIDPAKAAVIVKNMNRSFIRQVRIRTYVEGYSLPHEHETTEKITIGEWNDFVKNVIPPRLKEYAGALSTLLEQK